MKFSDNPGESKVFSVEEQDYLVPLFTRKNEYRIGDVYTALAGDTKFRHGILPIRVAVRK